MIDTVDLREALAAQYTTLCTHASLHTADPAGTGAAEVTGGAPAYARQPIVWNAGAADGSYASDPITFDVPAGTTVAFVGLWDALTAGVYRDKRAFQLTFDTQGTVTLVITYTQA